MYVFFYLFYEIFLYKVGRMDHQAKNEVFKTNLTEQDVISAIIKKVQVVKIREYIQKIQAENVENMIDVYLIR